MNKFLTSVYWICTPTPDGVPNVHNAAIVVRTDSEDEIENAMKEKVLESFPDARGISVSVSPYRESSLDKLSINPHPSKTSRILL